MAIASLVVPVLVVVVLVVFEWLLHGSWKTMETATLVWALLFLANMLGLYLAIRSLKLGQRRRLSILGIVLNSILLPFTGFILFFGISYVIST